MKIQHSDKESINILCIQKQKWSLDPRKPELICFGAFVPISLYKTPLFVIQKIATSSVRFALKRPTCMRVACKELSQMHSVNSRKSRIFTKYGTIFGNRAHSLELCWKMNRSNSCFWQWVKSSFTFSFSFPPKFFASFSLWGTDRNDFALMQNLLEWDKAIPVPIRRIAVSFSLNIRAVYDKLLQISSWLS